MHQRWWNAFHCAGGSLTCGEYVFVAFLLLLLGPLSLVFATIHAVVALPFVAKTM